VHYEIASCGDMLNCTFAGHREVFEPYIRDSLTIVLEQLLSETNEAKFFLGGMGEFDAMCSAAVRQLQHRHPRKKILLYLVCPYMTTAINRDAAYFKEQYDDVLIPAELMGCHYKSAIARRNRWLVEQCDTIITYVKRNYGGAYTTRKYAEKKGLTIIDLFGEKEHIT
jgi:uncharacterized phage-like protein YoqJ